MGNSVIIAESSRSIASAISDAFRESGYEVSGICEDGLSAVKLAEEVPPSVVTLDLILPRLSGIQLAEAMKRRPDPPLLIAVSAVTARERLAQAKDAGVKYYILKPFNNTRLKEILIKHLGSEAAVAV